MRPVLGVQRSSLGLRWARGRSAFWRLRLGPWRSAFWLLLLLPAFVHAASKPVLVHYMPWYVAKPYSAVWGWHWTMNHYNPDALNPDGTRPIASWYYPLIGPYDSADPVVLEYHVLLMRLGGVDGVIADWYGMDNYLDYGTINQRTLALRTWTEKAGLMFCLCYEDRTIQQEVTGGFITAANALAHAQRTLLYAQTNYFQTPNYLRWNNQPVLLNFGPQYFKNSADWQTLFSALEPAFRPAFFALDNRLAAGAGAFNWPPMWLSQANGGVLSVTQLLTYLAGFEQKASVESWPAFVSSAFPRFHDIYQQAGVGSSYGFLDDRNGDTFRLTLGRAFTNTAALVQVVTWNDFGEGTIVEPTREYGYRDLGMLQDFRRQYLDPAFSRTTNDLALPWRVYQSRRAHAGNAVVAAELDAIFDNLVSGDLALAAARLTALESSRPLIHSVALNGQSLRFSAGGYLAASGLEIQTSTTAAPDSWQTAATLPVGTAPVLFTTNLSAGTPALFFRLRNR